MKKRYCALSLILALLILVSCGESEQKPDNNDTDVTVDDSTEVVDEDSYPFEIKNYNGSKTFTVLNCIDGLGWAGSNHIIDYEGLTGETVSDAIYLRARDTESKFGIEINVEKLGMWDLLPEVKKIVLADEYVYDAVYAPLRDTMSGEFALNMLDIDSLHLDKDWWNGNFIKQATLPGNKLYSTIDYVNMMGYTYGNVMYFNKNMLLSNNLEMPYDLVRNGEWTYDKLNEYMSYAVNLNGDSSFTATPDCNCIFGFAFQHEEGTMSLLNGAGEMLVTRDKDNMPVLRSDVERFSNVYTKLVQILSQDGYSVMNNDAGFGGGVLFETSRALFYQGNLGLSGSQYRELNFEYGVLPLPKYDSAQDDYYTMASEYTLSLLIPKTVNDTDFSGRILDYMAYCGKRDIIPALQVQLCYKGMRDDDSIEMFNTILGALSLDIGYMFNWTQGLLKTLCGKNMLNGNDVFASTWAAQKDSIAANIEKTLNNIGE